MIKKLVILLSLISHICFADVGDSILFKLLFENNAADSSGSGITGTIQGVTTYSTTAYQGSYSMYPTSGRWESDDSIETTNTFAIGGMIRLSSTTSDAMILSTYYTSNSPGMYVVLSGSTNSIKVYTSNGTVTDYAYSDVNVFNDLTWFHCFIVFDNGVCRFYVNGTKVGYNSTYSYDSIVRSDFPTRLPINIHGRRDGSQTLSQQLRFDNIHAYNYVPTNIQIDSLYDYASTNYQLNANGDDIEPDTITGYTKKEPLRGAVTKKFLRNNAWVIPYRLESSGEVNPQDSLIVYFAENFNDWAVQSPIPYDTVQDRWQPEMPNFVSTNRANQSIVSMSDHGNVWRSQYLTGQGGANYSFAVYPLLDQKLEELWVEAQVYFASNWFDDPSDGYYSGKWPGGGILSGDNTSTSIDSSADYHCKGFSTHNTWGGTLDGVNPPNRIQTYIYDQVSEKSATVITGYYVNRGYWRTCTKRVVLNTPGSPNGFAETYIDGLLVQQVTGLNFRSVAQYNAGYNYIEGIILKYAFGGTALYTSQQDNVVYFDNVVAYNYTEGSPYHLNGLAPAGHTIPIVSGTLTSNHYPDKIFVNRTYTAASGTINGLTTGFRKAPWCKNTTTDYRTFTITGHSNPIRLQFTKWYDGGGGTAAEDMWVKIYSGTGTLLYTYNEATRDGVPTIGSTLTISSTSCIIEYCTGKDSSYPFELVYW